MEKYFFMETVLEKISQGQFFRKAFAVALQILAVLIAIAALVAWITVWKSISGYSPEAILGIIIFQLLFVIAVYMVVHILLIRAGNISALTDSEYTVIPIVSITLKLFGETYASFVTVISVAGGILTWFIGSSAFYMIKKSAPLVPSYGSGEGFVGGLVFMVGGLFSAFVGLVLFYFLAEAVVVLVDIAKNIKKMSK
ncbi:MAG: hypothetical protein WCO53_11985 [Deltaproteobacteria bacterium]